MNIIDKMKSKTLDLTLKNKALNLDLKSKNILMFKTRNYMQLIESLTIDDEDILITPKKFINGKQAVLKKLNTTFKNVYNNTGSTCLYLMVNFIQWKNVRSEYLAPLLLVPINIIKNTSYENEKLIEDFYISYSGEEVIVNAVLQEKMKSFGIEIPDFVENYVSYMETIESLFEDVDDHKFVKKLGLGILSYNSGLYKDCNESLWDDYFTNNNMINMLSNEIPCNAPIISNEKRLQNIICPADESQLVAIEAANNGDSFVLQGPPGTGKSQTIVNIMASLIANNKKILFVSEKESALEVVKNRLTSLNLGMFCLDIHNPKKTTKKILEQIRIREDYNGFDYNFSKNYSKYNNTSMLLEKEIHQYFNMFNTILSNGKTFHECLNMYNYQPDMELKKIIDEYISSTKTTIQLVELSKITNKLDNQLINYYSKFISYAKDFIECNIKNERFVPHDFINENDELSSPWEYSLKTNFDLIQHELKKQQRFQPLNKFISKTFSYLSKSCPIWMLSPVSVSKLLPRTLNQFDVLIMDEASQIHFESVLGAVLRSKQVIIVGDNKQMSPNNILTNRKGESALDVFEKYLPSISLNVHYRSESKSLIEFSNEKYYDNSLNIIPSITIDKKIYDHYVENGYYYLLINKNEAEKIVEFLKTKLKEYYKLPEEKWNSIGVITINTRQQELVEDLFNLELTKDEQVLDVYLRMEKSSTPLFIKNLETVQGDERDIIIISMTYGINPNVNKIYQRFRQFNSEYGWKKLNVLTTRAKKEMHVFRSFSFNDITIKDTTRKSVYDFKAFMEKVETPEIRNHINTVFEKFELLKDIKNLNVVCNIGTGEFKVDIGIVNENKISCGIVLTKPVKDFYDRYIQNLVKNTFTNKGWNIYYLDSVKLYNDYDIEKAKVEQFINSHR